ncbi:MAG: hypothetical protein LDL41_03270 [Coleofasciculus sp. S288]|nr:hypothetical protein [Coleofasciculus sp. S288]
MPKGYCKNYTLRLIANITHSNTKAPWSHFQGLVFVAIPKSWRAGIESDRDSSLLVEPVVFPLFWITLATYTNTKVGIFANAIANYIKQLGSYKEASKAGRYSHLNR